MENARATKMTTVSIRMNAELKQQFESFCNDMGLTMTTAMNLFARKTVREYRIPFEIGGERPNAVTLEAIREVEEMKKHPEQYKGYTNVDAMFKEILS